KFVPINQARASVRTNPITVSQPHVITKKDVNSDSNGLSSTGVDNTAKNRRPQPRSNTKNDKVPSASKNSCIKNKEVEVEEHPRNLPLSKNKKHVASECNNVKLAIWNDKSEVVYAMCKQCLITANHDVFVLNYVNDMNSRDKKHKADVSNTENQKKQKPKVMKPKKVWSKERLASPKPSKARYCLRWSPTRRLFDIKGKIIESSESESQFECSKGDNACITNPQEPTIKQFLNYTSFLGSFWELFNLEDNVYVAAILVSVDLQWGNILITRVYFVEGLGHNLFSVGQFCDSNLEVAFRRNTCFVRNLEGVDLLKGNRTTNLYTINLYEMASASPICLMARATSTKSWLWHQRLSHLNFDTINDLAKNDLLIGIPKFKYHKEHLCLSCEQGKSKRASHPPKPVPNLKQRLHLLHMDLCGPMRVESINGKRYVLVIVDDYSRYTWVHFLRSKDEAPEVIKTFLKKIQVLLQAPVIIVRTDNGTEFKNQVLKEYFDSVGISHQASYVRTPQQNGVVERRNHTLVEAARTMLIFSRAPLFLWAEAIATACYTQNRSIIHRRFDKTPYELINGRKVDISFLHVSGALCYPKNDREVIGKLGAKGDIGFFIGYSANSCAYRVYNRRTKKIMETMNVTFDELSAMAFEQSSSKPGLQSMTSGQISSGLDLTYAPSTITTQKPTEGELDLLFEAMYDDYIGGQPSSAPRTALAAQAPQVLQTPTATTTTADTAPTPTNSSSQATNCPNSSQDVDELETQQHGQHQPATIADNVPNAMFDENTFVNPFATPSTSDAASSSSQYVDPSNMHTSKGFDVIQNKHDEEEQPVTETESRSEIHKNLEWKLCDPVGTPMRSKTSSDPRIKMGLQSMQAQNNRSMICASTAKPTEKHLKDVKRIFSYLPGHRITGPLAKSWLAGPSKETDCTSVGLPRKAEMVSLSVCCAQVLWIQAISLQTRLQHSRTKHIAVRYHFIKEHVEMGTIELYFVKTDYQLADLFTKALPVDRFNYLVRRLGMRSLSPKELERLAKSQ
ncbi:retrovirus-related pol polyprotein from transposon TNT 1-94, partial [Tanacetum coccineum]